MLVTYQTYAALGNKYAYILEAEDGPVKIELVPEIYMSRHYIGHLCVNNEYVSTFKLDELKAVQ